MSQEFQDLMSGIADAIESRTINHPKEYKMQEYARGEYNPFFSLVHRDGKIVCVWTGNRKKQKVAKGKARREKEYYRISEGKCKTGLTSEEWDDVTLKVMHEMDLKL